MMTHLQHGLEIALLVQLVTFVLHDTVPLGRWNNLAHFRQEIPRARRLRGSILNTATALGTVLLFWLGWIQQGFMAGDFRMTLLITLGILLYMELNAWWRPYLFGATPAMVEKLRPNWAGTYAFLPLRNGLRPNAMHSVMHASTLAAFVFALLDHGMRHQ